MNLPTISNFMRGNAVISAKDLLINEEILTIKADEIRVVGEEGEALGLMRLRDAQELADGKNLDLVLIAPQGKPPVCKIMDYGKFKFLEGKRDKELKKNQKQVELKEVRMSLNIDTADFVVKTNNAVKFLKAGDKVKITIRFRGREMTHPKLGEALMERIKATCAEYGTAEKSSKFEGRNLSIVLAPKK
ncbi:translation initiation factor IF-3 [Clostridia bacterium]|nr:translation initiation factor IF-3 [Clostridia bacterium]